jgi:hypothetical protein
MKPQVSEAFAAFVGLDWADAKHDVCLQAAGTAPREFLSLEQSPEALHAWVQTLRTRFNGQPVAVCLELNKGLSYLRCATMISSCSFPSTRSP